MRFPRQEQRLWVRVHVIASVRGVVCKISCVDVDFGVVGGVGVVCGVVTLGVIDGAADAQVRNAVIVVSAVGRVTSRRLEVLERRPRHREANPLPKSGSEM